MTGPPNIGPGAAEPSPQRSDATLMPTMTSHTARCLDHAFLEKPSGRNT